MKLHDLALHGGPKTINKQFPWPVFDASDVKAVAEVVQSGAWGNPDCGGIVAALEQEFADFCGTRYAISCVNGSVALRLALIACGVRPGDEVIIPPYTFIATASIVMEANCVPVFADIEPETYNLDPKAVEKAITPRTRAIIPVHFAGQACNMDALNDIARKHGLKIIEDACHGHGGEYKDRKLGSIGDAGCFSFQSSKNMTSGEGGIVVTNDQKLADMVDSLRNVGRVKGGQWYEHHFLGCNYRITQLQAVLLQHQLKRLDDQTRRRNENGLYLNSLLEKIPGISPLTRGHGETLHTYHLYIFRYDNAFFNHTPKKEFAAMLTAEGFLPLWDTRNHCINSLSFSKRTSCVTRYLRRWIIRRYPALLPKRHAMKKPSGSCNMPCWEQGRIWKNLPKPSGRSGKYCLKAIHPGKFSREEFNMVFQLEVAFFLQIPSGDYLKIISFFLPEI
jgi:dTDP-4-amino-4,6-dideoxygalactose transaminase